MSSTTRRARQRLALLAIVAIALAVPLLAADSPGGKWAFTAPRRPAVPAVGGSPWVANSIDAFILAALQANGLRPNPPADKLTLLRRVTFDLTGLLPTPAEQHEFLADDSPAAYERLVDRLLESPRYGERWAQHWLDVVRFAETDGFKEDALRPTAWQYRNYVIRAFNSDLPYDRFVAQQLAGDELEPDNPEAQIATGLNRLYPDEYNAADVRQRRQQIHDDLTEATGLAFMGLTIGCAQCHDHKFDPISQVDYYRLQAFFAPLMPRDDIAIASPEAREQYARRQAEWEDATREIRGQIDALLAPMRESAMQDALSKFEPDVREAVLTPPQRQTAMERQLTFQAMKHIGPKMREVAGKLSGDDKKRFEDLERQLRAFDHLKPAGLPTAMAVTDAARDAPPTFRLALGNYKKPLEQVEPGFPSALTSEEPRISKDSPTSTGRRAALAAWLCGGDHPLTSRVMVNRIWQHHFGRGIVGTPNDFGTMGDPPSHPDLLDWLASEFVAHGWSVKSMHRLMVASSTYRQSSRVDFDNAMHARALELDGGNRLLWHARGTRLEGEAIRDAMLQLSGRLNNQVYGPSARPELPEGIDAKTAWKPDERAASRDRRSIYVLAKRNFRYPLLDVFDLPDMHNSCPQRSATITAPQALALLNSDFTLEQAQYWSGRLLEEHGGDANAVLRAAFEEAFSRAAADEQLESARRFVVSQAKALAEGGHSTSSLPVPVPAGMNTAEAAAIVDFCHAVLNANEFLYVD